MKMMRLILLSLTLLASYLGLASSENWPCKSEIYCKPYDGILHTVQTMQMFEDSKTFVDKPLAKPEKDVLIAWNALGPKPSKEAVQNFLNTNFLPEGTELEIANLTDWKDSPSFINKIQDLNFKNLATTLHGRWRDLARRTKKSFMKINESITSTFIPLQKPFIVPGGRFREVYYWDSYWTIKGLLLSELKDTVRGMLDNFKDLITQFGHIPNGNRYYYERRSQPPMFAPMVNEYLKMKKNSGSTEVRYWIANYMNELDKEMEFWKNRLVEVQVNGTVYKLARYYVKDMGGPRPESYKEDFELAQKLSEDKRQAWYDHIASGAETGWDFSSRWYGEKMNIEHPLLALNTFNIIPVDLNAILAGNAKILGDLFNKNEQLEKAKEYYSLHRELSTAIRMVLFSEEDGIWYDYSLTNKSLNRQMYPSNLMPIYTNCHHTDLKIDRLLDRLKSSGLLSYSGGVPASLYKVPKTIHQQQWDFPNVWAPLVEIVVTSLDRLGTNASKELALTTANNFLNNVFKSFQNSDRKMFEKYNCENPGQAGGGGEYEVQDGFGWSNGVTLDLLNRYPNITYSTAGLQNTAWMMLVAILQFVLILIS